MYDEDRNNDFYAQETGQVDATERGSALYLARVMGWMCLGLFTTVITALVCLVVPSVQYALLYQIGLTPIIIAQLAVVLILSFAVNKLSPAAATVLFMAYAALTGVTFFSLFFVFQLFSLVYVFGITSLIFVGMSIYGFATKKDLTRIGSLALFGLLGIIIAGVINLFFYSSMMDFAITVVGIVIFIVLIAFDTQKIKGFYLDALSQGYDDESPVVRKMAIFGALTLYLDFINLFLKLLRLLGRRRN